jgi:hypothetical protein
MESKMEVPQKAKTAGLAEWLKWWNACLASAMMSLNPSIIKKKKTYKHNYHMVQQYQFWALPKVMLS